MSMAFAVALLLQALPPPDGARWEQVVDDPDGVTSIDPASLRREGDMAIFVLRSRGVAAPPAPGEMFVLRAWLDCRRRLLGVEAADSYTLDGRPTDSRAVPPAEVVFEALGTSPGHGLLYARVCGDAR